MPFETHDSALMTMKDVCAYTKWSKSTVNNRINQKTFPAGVLIGKRRYWQFSDVRSVIESLMNSNLTDSRDLHSSY